MKAPTAFVLPPLTAKSDRWPQDHALPALRKLPRLKGGKDMKVPGFRAAFVAVAVAVFVTLSFSTTSFAQDDEGERFGDVLRAQDLYEKVLQRGRGGPHSGPYTAPLPGTTGPSYLWGGLDPISLLDRYNREIVDDPGGVVFISSSGSDLGKPEHALEVPIYERSRIFGVALFRSPDKMKKFIQMMNDGSLIIAFGMNCQWGVIAGPASNFASESHWAQPGLAAINVERFFDGRVTVLGVNFYSRGDDWKATQKRWKYAIEAFESLLENPQEEWERKRPEMPVIKVN